MYQKGIAPGTATGGPLDSVMGEIAGAPLECGVRAFESVHGVGAAYRTENLATLLELVIYLNAAHVARKARQWLDRDAMDASPHIAVVYGVVDPLRRCLHSRPAESVGDEPEPFASPPRDDLEFRSLADDIVRRLATSN